MLFLCALLHPFDSSAPCTSSAGHTHSRFCLFRGGVRVCCFFFGRHCPIESHTLHSIVRCSHKTTINFPLTSLTILLLSYIFNFYWNNCFLHRKTFILICFPEGLAFFYTYFMRKFYQCINDIIKLASNYKELYMN